METNVNELHPDEQWAMGHDYTQKTCPTKEALLRTRIEQVEANLAQVRRQRQRMAVDAANDDGKRPKGFWLLIAVLVGLLAIMVLAYAHNDKVISKHTFVSTSLGIVIVMTLVYIISPIHDKPASK